MFILHETHNPNIYVIEIIGDLTVGNAIEFHEYLFTHIDEGKNFFLIDLKRTKKVDFLFIMALEHAMNRGVQIRLSSVESDIRCIFGRPRDLSPFKIYNETDRNKAVLMFEKEILGEGIASGEIKNRRVPRIDTFFKADFKYHTGHNGVISGRATIINFSEGGMFAEQILSLDVETEEIVIPKEIADRELYDMKFRLNENSDHIETRGECVRVIRTHEMLCVGIRFKGMRQDHKKMIKDYVYESLQSE